MTTKAEKLRQQRAELNRQIKAAERAEKLAQKAALLKAKHGLGEWLADAMNLTSVEAIDALRQGLNPDALQGAVSAQPVTENQPATDGGGTRAVDENSSPHGHEGGQRFWN